MITRARIYLELLDGAVPEASAAIERDGYALLRGAFGAEETATLGAAVTAVYDTVAPSDRPRSLHADERDQFRQEMLNHSAAVQEVVGDRRILDVVEPLVGEDCHVISNTAWRNPAGSPHEHGGNQWHIDAGPPVPRPAGVPWDDRIPYPVFVVAVHLLLEDCDLASGPTAVVPGSHRSGQAPPLARRHDADLTYDGRAAVPLVGAAGDVVLFASDVWHRRAPVGEADRGRFFLQVHYGRRDIAQRLRVTSRAHQLSPEAVARAEARDRRARTLVGLHRPGFYDG
jgi:ectoine hydroxylase-related dioxygenase (phytanoyl-CoA dioxygenase family)